MDNIDMLYDLCEIVSCELDMCNEKVRKAGGKLSAGDVEYLDKLTHTLKSLKTTIAMEEGGLDGDYYNRSYDDGDGGGDGSNSYGRSYGNSYARNRRGSYDGGSYARGRGRYAKRDSMGRYARDDGGKEHMMEQLQEMLNNATDEKMRSVVRKAMEDLNR